MTPSTIIIVAIITIVTLVWYFSTLHPGCSILISLLFPTLFPWHSPTYNFLLALPLPSSFHIRPQSSTEQNTTALLVLTSLTPLFSSSKKTPCLPRKKSPMEPSTPLLRRPSPPKSSLSSRTPSSATSWVLPSSPRSASLLALL